MKPVSIPVHCAAPILVLEQTYRANLGAVASALASQREMAGNPDGWVFPSATAKCGHIKTVKKPFRKTVVAANLNLKEITPYTLRHTAITKLIEKGVDLPTVQKVSGHRRIDMVLRYAHVRDSHIDDAIATLEKKPVTQELHAPSKAAGTSDRSH